MFPNQDPNRPQPTPAAAPQRSASGQYDVVPPLPIGQNTGHSGHNPYEFIVSPNQPPRRGLKNLFGGNSFIKKIAVIVGGAVLLIIALTIIINMAFPSSSSKVALTTLAEQQQELVRVATEGEAQAVNQTVKNFAVTVQLGVASSQQQILNYLTAHGTKLSPKTLSSTENSQTDTKLTEATASSTFDVTLVQTLSDQLDSYETQLQQTFKNTRNSDVKKILQQSFQAASLLQDQAKTAAGQLTSN